MFVGIIFLLSWFGLLILGIYNIFIGAEILDCVVPLWLFVFWWLVFRLI